MPQLNGSEGKLFQYISVARQDKPGIVQVGVSPQILDGALANHRIDAVIGNYNVPAGVNVLAFDAESGVVVGDNTDTLVGTGYWELGLPEDFFSGGQTTD